MSRHPGETAYRSAAAGGATQIGLLILVYDALAQDLHKAGQAVRGGDFVARCTLSNHGLLLLGHLQSWTEHLDSQILSASLNQFYGYLRAAVLQLQRSGTEAEFSALAQLVLETRATWQRKEQMLSEELARSVKDSPANARDTAAGRSATSFAWSA